MHRMSQDPTQGLINGMPGKKVKVNKIFLQNKTVLFHVKARTRLVHLINLDPHKLIETYLDKLVLPFYYKGSTIL